MMQHYTKTGIVVTNTGLFLHFIYCQHGKLIKIQRVNYWIEYCAGMATLTARPADICQY